MKRLLPLSILTFALIPASLATTGTYALDEKPAPKLAGTWTWSWKDKNGDTHKHVLAVEGVGKTLAAREIFDEGPPKRVEKLKLDGQTLKFSVTRGERLAEYNGKIVDADHIDGVVIITVDGHADEHEWKAERSKTVPK